MLILYVIPFMAVGALIFLDYRDPARREWRDARESDRAAFADRRR